MKKNRKDDQLIKFALATVSLELIKAIIELIVKLIELVGGK